jgi:hypothetical protein
MIFIVLILFHFIILKILQFTAWPEMLSYPYLFSNGFSIYKDIALPYQPLLTILLTGFYKVLGFNLFSLQVITYLFIFISDILIFVVSRKILGKAIVSILPLTIYILVQPLAEGNMLWFDLATVPFILAAIYCYLTLKSSKLFWMGFFLILAFLIKQQVGVVIMFVLLYLLIYERSIRNILTFFSGMLLPVIFTLIFISLTSNFEDYFFWTVIVPIHWYPRFPGYVNIPSFKEAVTLSALFLPSFWLCLVKTKEKFVKLLLFIFVALFMVAFPRFELFRMQPALAVFTILFLYAVKLNISRKVLFAVTFIGVLFLVKGNLNNVFLPPRFYGEEEFREVEMINRNSALNEKVYLLGINSTGYVLTNHLPTKPWVDNYIWYMEIDGIQEKVIEGFEKDKPQVIFWKTPKPGNWYDLGTYQPEKITRYIKTNYQEASREGDIQIWKRN